MFQVLQLAARQVRPELNPGAMIQTSIDLPKKYRLEVRLAKRRKDPVVKNPILPSVQDILNVRKGSRVSRVFTHIFSHRHIKKILGGNIAAAILLTNIMPASAAFGSNVNLNTVNVNAVVAIRTEKGVQYPVEGTISITQGYYIFHPGVDIDGITGDPVKPIMAGKVTAIQYSKFSYGNAIIIDHGSGLTSLYAHLSKIEVTENQDVTKTTEIGKVGSTGHSTGDHLHLEIHQDGRPINPMSVLPR